MLFKKQCYICITKNIEKMKKYFIYTLCGLSQLPLFITPFYFLGFIGIGIILGITICNIANDIKN